MTITVFALEVTRTQEQIKLSPLNIAVAANFYSTARLLVDEFTAKTGIACNLLQGSSGKLFAQIRQAAPFDVFLSADEKRIDDLLALKLIYSPIIYAQGSLALVASADLQFNDFVQADFSRLAIPNAKLAPYGVAAEEVLQYYGLLTEGHAIKNKATKSKVAKSKELVRKFKTSKPVNEKLTQIKIVIGQSALQTYQFVVSNNVDFALLPLSYALESNKTYWPIKRDLYTPLKQAGAILSRSKNLPGAEAFMHYIQSSEAIELIVNNGYSVETYPIESSLIEKDFSLVPEK